MANYETQDLQYRQMMQENITRMAGNSANAKTWLITIVTVFLAIGCRGLNIINRSISYSIGNLR